MYGKSYLNICIRLENTLVLERYPRRLSEKRVLVGPDLVTVILNYSKVWKSGLWGRQATTWQSCRRFFKITVSTSNTWDQFFLNCRFGSWKKVTTLCVCFFIKSGPVARLNLMLKETEITLFTVLCLGNNWICHKWYKGISNFQAPTFYDVQQ